MAQPTWQFAVASSAGVNLSLLPLATDATITGQLCAASVLEFSIPLTAPGADQIIRGETRIKGYRAPEGSTTSTIRFNGIVWTVEKEASESGVAMMKVVAVDPFGSTLAKRFSTANLGTVDQGTALQNIVDTANAVSDTFVSTSASSVTASITRTIDWTLTRKSLADAFTEVSSALDGTDWTLQPVDNGATIAQLIVHGGRRGSVRDEIVFGYGEGTVGNCSSMRETSSMDNAATWIQGDGQGGAYWQWTNPTKVAKLGRYERYSSYGDVTNSAYLTSLVYNDLVASYDPAPIVGFTASVRAPRMYDEWDLGDTVRVQGRRGALQVNTSARILGASLTISANGVEMASSIVTQAPGTTLADSVGTERQ